MFRNCRLIGRRFHLAHVRFGYEIIEVATFRAAHTTMDEDNSVDEAGHRVLDERGRILRDNLYGTIEEDVWRRDFTANALYYNIEDFSVWDYVGGVRRRRSKSPAADRRPGNALSRRSRADAARRAFRGEAGIHASIRTPPRRYRSWHGCSTPCRLRGSSMKSTKCFSRAARRNTFDLLYRMGLLEHLFPDLAAVIHEAPDSTAVQVLRVGLQGTDERVLAEKSVTPTFLFAVLLWPAIQQAYSREPPSEGAEAQHLLALCERVTARQQARVAIPKRFTLPLREIVGLQPRFERREGRRALRLFDHPRFRAAYDFLLLRAAAGEVDAELAQWWTDIQTALGGRAHCAASSRQHGAPRHGACWRRRRRRRRRRRAPPA